MHLNKKLHERVKAMARKKFKRYPSAYASSWITREYKKRGGKFSKRTGKLNRWYAEKWIQVIPYLRDNKQVECGKDPGGTKACRPLKRISKKTPITIKELLKIYKKEELLKLAKKKRQDMKKRVTWNKGVYSLRKSTKAGKKYMLVTPTKKIHFGAKGYSDYTLHKDPKRKRRYITRHKARENWKDPLTAGALSRWILWNKPTLSGSIKDFEKRFKLKIDTKYK